MDRTGRPHETISHVSWGLQRKETTGGFKLGRSNSFTTFSGPQERRPGGAYWGAMCVTDCKATSLRRLPGRRFSGTSGHFGTPDNKRRAVNCLVVSGVPAMGCRFARVLFNSILSPDTG